MCVCEREIKMSLELPMNSLVKLTGRKQTRADKEGKNNANWKKKEDKQKKLSVVLEHL